MEIFRSLREYFRKPKIEYKKEHIFQIDASEISGPKTKGLEKEVIKAIGTQFVRIHDVIRESGFTPWAHSQIGRETTLNEVINLFGTDGYPGYDYFPDGLAVFLGLDKSGREHYMITPTKEGEPVDGGIVVCPIEFEN